MPRLYSTSCLLMLLSVSTLAAQVQPRLQGLAYDAQLASNAHSLASDVNGSSTSSPVLLLQQRQPGEKSPALAGILSFFIPFGTGSFYAGHDGHGVRHLVFGGVTLVGAVAGLAVACDDGFDFCDEDDPAYAVAGIFGIGYLVNVIWGTITAIGDANAYNRQLRESALQFAPGVTLVDTSASLLIHGKPGSVQRVGLRAVRVVF